MLFSVPKQSDFLSLQVRRKMDLAKIIGELRLELQCLEAAIASMEELARVQNLVNESGEDTQPDPPPPGEPPVAKRRRGRPRKSQEASSPEEPPQHMPPGSVPTESDDSSISAA